MEIIGIGNDVVQIPRIEALLERYDQRFKDRIFTEAEQKRAQVRVNSHAVYAKIFAAKEACLKALGTGLSQGISWHDIEVSHLASGKPIVTLTNKAKECLETYLADHYRARIHLTISDDYPIALAFVVIEAVCT